MRVACLLLAGLLGGCDSARPRDQGNPRPADPVDSGQSSGVDAAPGLDASADQDGGPSDATPPADAGQNDAAPADAGFTDTGVPGIRGCLRTCSAPNDCVVGAGTVIADADNYACSNQRCVYLGCLSDTECAAVRAGLVCRLNGSTIPSCVQGCASPSDCALPGSPLFTAADYQCIGGGCAWGGCSDTQECTSSFQDSRYVCGPVPGLSFNNCVLGCTDGTQCVSAGAGPAFDADNYVCPSGTCEYAGCNSDAECQAQNNDANWVCQ